MRLFKFSIIIETILIVILLVASLFISTKGDKLKINALHPNEFYVALGSLFVLLLISCLLAFVVTSFQKAKSENSALDDVEKTKRNLNFWKFTFYTNLGFTFCLLLYSLFAKFSTTKPLIIYEVSEFVAVFFGFALGTIVLSLLIGALFLGSLTFYKTNKPSSIITLIIGILFFICPFYLVAKYKYRCEAICFNYSTKEEINDLAEETDESDYDCCGEEGDDGSFSFKSIWDDPENDETNVLGAMELFLFEILNFNTDILNVSNVNETSKLRSYLLKNFEKTEQDNLTGFRRTFSFLIDADIPSDLEDTEGTEIPENETNGYRFIEIVDEVDRNPAKIAGAFESYNHMLYALLDKKLYVESDLEKVVNILIQSHEDIEKFEKSDQGFKNIYQEMKAPKKDFDFIDVHYDFVSKYMSSEIKDYLDYIKTENEFEATQNDIVWVYSFWARRDHEGNREEVLNILKEIKANYTE